MKLSSRLSGLRWAGLLTLLFSSSQLAWAQSSQPVNPLRRASTESKSTESKTAKTVAPAVAEAEITEPVVAEAVAETPLPVSRVTRARLRARRSVRPASYGLFGPRETQLVAQEIPPPGDSVLGEEIVIDGPPKQLPGEIVLEKGWGGGDCCGGKGCSECCSPCFTFPCPQISFENLELFGGVQGFTGPKNRGGTGSFGFDTGFNWGAPLLCSGGCLGVQFGLRSTFSNFSGAEFTRDDRTQIFLTGGLFRRVDWGLQGGLAIDYLADRWYTNSNLVQLRGELSWVYPHAHEFGIWFTAHTQSDTQSSVVSSSAFGSSSSGLETWEGTDLFAFFYRKRVCNATGRFYAGFSNHSDGLIGGDLLLPLSDCWALESGFAYLVPEQPRTGATGGGHEHESWNVGINLVWTPGSRSDCGYYRPLLNVADNGSFMVDRK